MPIQLTPPKGLITVRPAQEADATSLRKLRLEALADSPEMFAADHDLTAAESDAHWAERIAEGLRSQNSVICIAEAAERLIGMTGLGRGHWPITQHSAVIWGVYVAPEFRGLHIAEALIEECIAWGRERGVSIVKLGVITNNAPAIRCYLRCGFKVYGVDPWSNYYNGRYFDELLMAKAI